MEEVVRIINNIVPFLIARGDVNPLVGLIMLPIIILLANKLIQSDILARLFMESTSEITVYDRCEMYSNPNVIYINLVKYINDNYELGKVNMEQQIGYNTINIGNNNRDKKLQYIIVSSKGTRIKYNNKMIKVIFGTSKNKESNRIRKFITIKHTDITVLQNFLSTVKKYDKLKVIKSHYYDNAWIELNIYNNKSFTNLFLDHEVKSKILDELNSFITDFDIYVKAGIPYKKGFLFHGKPGCGKTSCIYAMSKHLNFSIYKLNLSNISDKAKLLKVIIGIPKKSIVIIEDIDCLKITHVRGKKYIEISGDCLYSDKDMNLHFNSIVNKLPDDFKRWDVEEVNEIFNNNFDIIMEDEYFHKFVKENPDEIQTIGLQLSDILEIFDGNEYLHNCIVIFTSNFPEKLDSALIRPGRIDSKIRFEPANDIIINEIFTYFYDKNPEIITADMRISQAELINTIILPNIKNYDKALSELIAKLK